MDALPTELLLQIAALCDYNTLFRLRALNKYLSSAFTPLAFERIYVGWNEKHLEHLQDLAGSGLAKHIRCLTVNTEILPSLSKKDWMWYLLHSDHDSLAENRDPFDDDLSFDDPDPSVLEELLLKKYSMKELNTDFRKFYELSRSQRRERQDMGEHFVGALALLPNLRHLGLSDRRGDYARSSASLGCVPTACDPIASCSPWKDMSLDPISYYGTMHDRWHAEDIPPKKGTVCSAYILSSIAEPFADRYLDPWGTGRLGDEKHYKGLIKELTIDVGHFNPVNKVFRKSAFRANELPYGNFFCSFFANLERVDLSLNQSQYQHADRVYQEIAKALTQAKNLRHLEIDNRRSEERYIFHALQEQSYAWPYLEHLRLSGVVPKRFLLETCRSSARSLRAIELVEIELYDPDGSSRSRWDNLFEELQPMLEIERANVRSLYSWARSFTAETLFPLTAGEKSEMNRNVEDYLTRKVDSLPRQENWECAEGKC